MMGKKVGSRESARLSGQYYGEETHLCPKSPIVSLPSNSSSLSLSVISSESVLPLAQGARVGAIGGRRFRTDLRNVSDIVNRIAHRGGDVM